MECVPTWVVGRNDLFRLGLKSYLKSSSFEVVGEATSFMEAVRKVDRENPPELLLLNLGPGSIDFVAPGETFATYLPNTEVVILADTLSLDHITTCLKAGAGGYLLSDISCNALQQCLRLVLLGEKVFPSQLLSMWTNSNAKPRSEASTPARGAQNLSERESEILECLVQGASNKMIANRLNITEGTVKVHMKSLLRKIDAANRTQAAIWALNAGYSNTVEGM